MKCSNISEQFLADKVGPLVLQSLHQVPRLPVALIIYKYSKEMQELLKFEGVNL